MIPLVGTRKSKLALAYTEQATKLIPFQTNTILIDSTGDLNPTTAIEEMGGKGVFCKEIEQSLMDKQIDIAIHAFKDLTRDNDAHLHIPCVLPRNDHHDCLVGNNINPRSIGTSSPRRIQQIRELYPNAEVVPIRGNIDTRINKQENGEYDAIILAKAGLDALGLTHKISRVFGTADMLPAPGQGVIALQMRIDDRMSTALSNVNHWDTWYMAMAEKQALKEIDGDCQTPIGMLSIITNGNIKIIGRNFETMKISVQEGPIHQFQEIGSALGRSLI
jgi:hydroxymethylbilane synthase